MPTIHINGAAFSNCDFPLYDLYWLPGISLRSCYTSDNTGHFP
jgi:hypothetical protein